MLRYLEITNYALISQLEIDFESGFSVLTGETGAGKSIIIGALSLILGQRADSKAIKEGEQKCIIEADFKLKTDELSNFFSENELDYDPNSCLIRRELGANGKSRAFINDTPVSLNQLRTLSSQLIDIHSQHENLLIANENYQLNLVDTFAQNKTLLVSYKNAYENWQLLSKELKELKKTAEKQQADLDYISFQYQQLSDAALKENEQEELEQEQNTLSHSEEIKTELFKATRLLSDEEMALSLIRESNNALARVSNYLPEGEEWNERLHSVVVELKDIADEMREAEERVEFNPQRLEQIEERLSTLYGLLKKYKVDTIAELLGLQSDFKLQLENIEFFDQNIASLEKSVNQAEEVMKKQSENLRQSRLDACQPIKEYMETQLAQLGMPNAKFEVEIKPSESYSESGNDIALLLFSANKNKSLQPIIQIASGGEISRLMLSLKALIAHREGLASIIFDEIDSGVSGEIASRMGDIMLKMAQNMQVISITHLPQIAAKGKIHYEVYKKESDNQVQSFIRKLNAEERIQELAKMLSAEKVTEAAISQAKELIESNN